MSKRAVLHLKKGRTWLIHTGKKKRGSGGLSAVVLVPDQYGDSGLLSGGAMGAADEDVRYGITLHPYPLEIVDYLGHYFLPVEKAA